MNGGRKDPLRNWAGNWKHCRLTALRCGASFLPSVVGNGADVTGRRGALFLAPQKVKSRISLNCAAQPRRSFRAPHE